MSGSAFGGFQVGVDAQRADGLGIAAVEGNAVLDVDAVAFFVLFQGLDIVADLPLEADVGHQTVARLGVDAGHIACIGVAVGVAVLDVEQDDEIIAVLDGLRHGLFLLILLA